MTVRVKPTSIEFVNESGNTFTLTETSEGFIFDGVINTRIYAITSTTAGYTSGGASAVTPPISIWNVIDKFPFATNANATDVGDLTVDRYSGPAGQSSTVSGYTSGGRDVSGISQNVIDKFPFATNANATDVGDLTVAGWGVAGQSSSDNGYTSGGFTGSASNVIDKFPFATNANATDVGDLTVARREVSGQSSSDNGYTSGGFGPVQSNVIDKFPFATNSNATDVGDLTVLRRGPAGQSSSTSGYTSGGASAVTPPISTYNEIDKFPFATNANATDVGDLSARRHNPAGQSSSVSGYTSGGYFSGLPSSVSNVIDKFPFATNANATDVGDLTVARTGVAGHQSTTVTTYY